MAAKLLSLRNVPDTEADDIRELLTKHRIDFYETPPNYWGISAPIIWLEDPTDLDIAKDLLETFQEELTRRERAAYAERIANNQQPTLLDALLRHPLQVVAFLALAGIIAYISIAPFINLGQ
ncbi:MAG: DUF6164 family protein [Thiolinea sp.]